MEIAAVPLQKFGARSRFIETLWKSPDTAWFEDGYDLPGDFIDLAFAQP